MNSPAKVAAQFFAAAPMPAMSPSAKVAALSIGVGGGLRSAAEPSVFMTPYEIYLEFRTAPYGSLGVTDSLFESASYMSQYVGAAWGVGYTLGTAINDLIDNYDPSLETTIGGTIDQTFEDMQSAATELEQGQFQDAADSLFGNPLPMDSTGDWGVTIPEFKYFESLGGC